MKSWKKMRKNTETKRNIRRLKSQNEKLEARIKRNEEILGKLKETYNYYCESLNLSEEGKKLIRKIAEKI